MSTLAAVLTRVTWEGVWIGGIPRAWDGTGHYGIAQIYNNSIFPDTFGWTNAYFTGMPFPNFYPPLFYWLVSLLAHTHLFSFALAFKLVVSLPMLFLPVLIWKLAFEASGRDRISAIAATVIAIFFLVDLRSWTGGIPTGLDYYSTFLVGLYTQPLAFVFFILWLLNYQSSRACGRVSYSFSSLLLSLTILTNFFIAITAAFFVAATIACDFYEYVRAGNMRSRTYARRKLVAHALSPMFSCALALFWLLPMLKSYKYLVTRPYVFKLTDLMSPAMWTLYAIAAVGFILWGRRRASWFAPYLIGCLGLATALSFTTFAAPSWFPLQPQRFMGVLNLLLCVPAGYTFAQIYRLFYGALSERANESDESARVNKERAFAPGKNRLFVSANAALAIVITVDALLFIRPPYVGVGFYPKEGDKDVQSVLNFAAQRKDGRYLVEADLNEGAGKFDARAINAYLGAQGNETLGAIFHEASPNSLYFLPLINVFSEKADSFGISSRLTDDLDFANQSLEQHVQRAKLFGVRYLVIHSPEVKLRIERQVSDYQRYDFGDWSVYGLEGGKTPAVRVLPYKPALVIGGLNLKQRTRDENGFTRLVEEQFADNWFDVLLLHSNEQKIDKLKNLDQFGPVIVGDYTYDDENAAYNLLSQNAARHLLILLPSNSSLFRRIQSNLSSFPGAKIVDMVRDDPNANAQDRIADRFSINANSSVTNANSSVRSQRGTNSTDNLLIGTEAEVSYKSDPIQKQWMAIRDLLQSNKESIHGLGSIYGSVASREIQLHVDQALVNDIPVLIASSFHPGWHRNDDGEIYAATPFHMVTFIRRDTKLLYRRDHYELTALWISAATLALLLFMLVRDLLSVTWKRRRSLGVT